MNTIAMIQYLNGNIIDPDRMATYYFKTYFL